MSLGLSILYRGPVTSCNYRCTYCPFSKSTDTTEALEVDRHSLMRFVDWTTSVNRKISVFFTPWGEALVRPWYQEAVSRLSHVSNVVRVVAQTNLSGPLDWLAGCNTARVGLWCTYHPDQVNQEYFLYQCSVLHAFDVRYSVGAVGIVEAIPKIEQLRERLPRDVYFWVNAYKHESPYYTADQLRRLEAIDPLFMLNAQTYPSYGCLCHTGSTSICVYGDGTARRCHLSPKNLGNIYQSELSGLLRVRTCNLESCHCHIGYVHMASLGLSEVFRLGLLERIPDTPIWSDETARAKAIRHVRSTLQRKEDLPLPSPPPAGTEWIEAHRHWAGGV